MAHSIKRSGYNCCYSGCSWSGKLHRFYIEHISRIHFLNKNILCNFAKKCLERFDSIQSLQLHVKRYHHRQNIQMLSSTAGEKNSDLSILTPTQCTLCTKMFRSTKLLMTHFNTFHSSETRPCIFKNCSTVFGPFAESRHHFLKSHKYIPFRPACSSLSMGQSMQLPVPSLDFSLIGQIEVVQENILKMSTGYLSPPCACLVEQQQLGLALPSSPHHLWFSAHHWLR